MMHDRSYVRSGRPSLCFKSYKGTEEGTPYLRGVWNGLCSVIFMVQEFTFDYLSLEGEDNTIPQASVNIHPTTQHNIAEDMNHHHCHCDNLKNRTHKFIMC